MNHRFVNVEVTAERMAEMQATNGNCMNCGSIGTMLRGGYDSLMDFVIYRCGKCQHEVKVSREMLVGMGRETVNTKTEVPA